MTRPINWIPRNYLASVSRLLNDNGLYRASSRSMVTDSLVVYLVDQRIADRVASVLAGGGYAATHQPSTAALGFIEFRIAGKGPSATESVRRRR